MTDKASVPLSPADGVVVEEAPRVVFQHPFFAAFADAHFQISEQNGEVVMVANLAKNDVVMPLHGIKREFQIADDSPDGMMLAQVTKALKFVRGLHIGDALPKEILTREASWTLEGRYVQIAYQRVSLQLANWLTGGQQVITDPDELLQLANDPQIKRAVSEAFAEAAEKLGLGRDNKAQVIAHVEALAHELAYIEALRDQFRHVARMVDKVQALRRIYGREHSVLEVADQVARLAERALAEYDEAFLEVDAQTGEVLSVLRNLKSGIDYIRERRDELHAKLMVWDDLLAEWDRAAVKASPEKPDMLRRAYHFLAPRFMLVKEWVLMSKLRGSEGREGLSQIGDAARPTPPKNVMRW
jgi:hypothetical protein